MSNPDIDAGDLHEVPTDDQLDHDDDHPSNTAMEGGLDDALGHVYANPGEVGEIELPEPPARDLTGGA